MRRVCPFTHRLCLPGPSEQVRKKRMIQNPKLNIKSDYLAGIVKRALAYEGLSPAQQRAYHNGKTAQESGELLIGSFLFDVLRNGHMADVALDMTYGTLDMLPAALRHRLQLTMSRTASLGQAAESAARSFAAYLFALGMNEEGGRLKVVQKGTELIRPRPDEGPLWGPYLRITTGNAREKDFLPPALEGGSVIRREGKTLMLLQTGPAIRAYRGAFGVELGEKGLRDMELELD